MHNNRHTYFLQGVSYEKKSARDLTSLLAIEQFVWLYFEITHNPFVFQINTDLWLFEHPVYSI